jgi:predicted SAM-dependent methyltransferase
MKLKTKIAYVLFPSYVWSVLTQEVYLTRLRLINLLLPQRRKRGAYWKKARNLAVHLGCGKRIRQGWVNVDAGSYDGIDLQWDLRYRFPFQNSSAKMIYTEHTLEHFHKHEAVDFLRECYRILEPGGRIQVGVPDAELYLCAYAQNKTRFFESLQHLGGATVPLETPIDVINQMFRMGGHHHFAWDYQALASSLTDLGYQDIARFQSGHASIDELCLDDPAHAFETLYVEAVKPLPVQRI